jgi:hypothetical protein
MRLNRILKATLANKNVSIQLYLHWNTESFIEDNYRVHINLKTGTKIQTAHNKTTQKQTNFLLTSKLDSLIYNNLNKDLGDNILIDSMWLDS